MAFRTTKWPYLVKYDRMEAMRLLREALKSTSGDVSRAAEKLGLSRRWIYNLMEKLKVSPEAYR